MSGKRLDAIQSYLHARLNCSPCAISTASGSTQLAGEPVDTVGCIDEAGVEGDALLRTGSDQYPQVDRVASNRDLEGWVQKPAWQRSNVDGVWAEQLAERGHEIVGSVAGVRSVWVSEVPDIEVDVARLAGPRLEIAVLSSSDRSAECDPVRSEPVSDPQQFHSVDKDGGQARRLRIRRHPGDDTTGR
jgi:hypothetical protein